MAQWANMLAIALGSFILAQSLIPNGTFEEGNGGRVAAWRTQTWSGRAAYSWVQEGRGGSKAVLIEGNPELGADASWSTTLSVKPYSKYKLTAYVKTVNVKPVNRGLGALINFHGRPEKTQALTGTQDWTPLEITFDTGADDAIQVNCLLGYYGTASGKAWFDDFSLQLLETRELNPNAIIDASKTFQPIPKYIYSQFIEHLGRCIYGGIWAEMLEDRKFYYPVGKDQSPWKKTGTDGVEMDAEHAFVGNQAVGLLSEDARAGIRQDGLHLAKGKKYVGYAWLRADSTQGPVEVKLAWGDGPQDSQSKSFTNLTGTYKRFPFEFTAGANAEDARLEISSAGRLVNVGTVSLMPADNVSGMRKDTIALLKELNAPLYRWPGGNFVSGYDWRDGIGDRDRRPTRKNPAWQGIEPNDFGTHEFLEFCRVVGTEPLIVVNTGYGDAHSGAAWLQYVNGAATTEEGQRRSKNGRQEPWNVKWWGIGNEMYGPWQLGHMALDQYVVKHNLFFDRMTAVDPTIKTIASSDLGGGWSQRMLTDCVNQMTLISEHFYCQEKPGVMAHVAQIPNAIRGKVEAHRRLRDTLPSLKGKDIRIAMDEWNYWYGPHVYGELGTRYFVKDGLGIAAGLHEYFRSTDIVGMAQYAQTVNVIGAIKTTPTAAAFETTGLVLKLYRQRFGIIPLAVEGAPEPLDVSAALTEDRKFLTIAVVNPTDGTVRLPLTWKGIALDAKGKGWQIANSDPMAYNTPGEEQKVKIVDTPEVDVSKGIDVDPYSVTLLRIPVKG